MRQKRKHNPTVSLMARGLLKFKRRVDFPLWHPDHVKKVARVMREYADRMDEIGNSNSLRGADKTLYAQSLIVEMNNAVNRMTPTDPRERGAERGGYNHNYGKGYLNTNGFDELLSRDDLNE